MLLVRDSQQSEPGKLVRVLSRRRLIELGLFSYSIYLIHSPVIGLANLASRHIAMPGIIRFVLLLLIVVPLAVLCSRGFFELVERRFLTSHQVAAESATQQSAVQQSPVVVQS